jgi:hypothetical protein
VEPLAITAATSTATHGFLRSLMAVSLEAGAIAKVAPEIEGVNSTPGSLPQAPSAFIFDPA